MDKPIVSFENIKNLEDAKYLQGREIYAFKEDLSNLKIQLPIELIGSLIYIYESKDREIGSLVDIIPGSNYEFLDIKTTTSKQLLIPFTQDFIKKISYENKQIFVSNASGFLDDAL